ncbi:glycosyltransferase [Paenibacillus sp. P96]|uniref:Glucosyl-3-phosphoglycerate synthase n=1 Tax=Paenibacillus zeirhizosphaerae TaxID=2987519 RepID=A0ABT9FV43_9BACL|nr:glycosyltransferase family 2 protein [Paenibacillus sp. P96]MDP4098480.1 glycosyltransferase [Paenibacillus sp. P96]
MMGGKRRSASRLHRRAISRGRTKSMRRVRPRPASARRPLKKSSSGPPAVATPFILNRSAAAVVTACNEEDTIANVLRELKRLPLQEIIVVLNGCRDETYRRALEFPGILIVNIPEKLGYDVGRGIGARLSTADCVLFVDGDMRIPAEELYPFLSAVDQGYDVALNHLTPLLPPFKRQDSVTRCKGFLNRLLKRSDLGNDSMTAVPHALSRRCLEEIGPQTLVVPPLAHSTAILKGMKVAPAHTVDVLTRNKRRHSLNEGAGNPVEALIVGDHAEAAAYVLSMMGRGKMPASLSTVRVELAKRRNGLSR